MPTLFQLNKSHCFKFPPPVSLCIFEGVRMHTGPQKTAFGQMDIRPKKNINFMKNVITFLYPLVR